MGEECPATHASSFPLSQRLYILDLMKSCPRSMHARHLVSVTALVPEQVALLSRQCRGLHRRTRATGARHKCPRRQPADAQWGGALCVRDGDAPRLQPPQVAACHQPSQGLCRQVPRHVRTALAHQLTCQAGSTLADCILQHSILCYTEPHVLKTEKHALKCRPCHECVLCGNRRPWR